MTNDFKQEIQNNEKLSKEEYAKKKKMEKDTLYKLLDETAMEIVSDPEKFQEYLNTQSRMDRYSANNAILIYAQYPKATKLKDFEDWGKEQVKINKGEKCISIIEPVDYKRADGTEGVIYNVKKMFDVSQTNGRKTPAVTANNDPKKLITALLDASPVEVKSIDSLPYPNTAVYYSNDKQILYVKKGVGNSVFVAQCVAQELGHAQLSIASDRYSRKDMGFKAVCIGYMLCRKYGVSTENYAIDRIPEELQKLSPREIRNDLSKMRNAMEKIHCIVSKEMKQQKEHERER